MAFHSSFTHPLPPGHRFPMLKYELLYEQLLYEGVLEPEAFFAPEPVQCEHILNVHDPEYWGRLCTLKLSAKEIRRIGFPLSDTLLERELRIAQGSILAAESALSLGLGFNIAGGTHHAGSNWGEGFCLLNDQAIAAGYLLSRGWARKILIIDLDVHQGNGTAEIFRRDERVFTFSMHGANNFPFQKEQSDLDIPLPDNTADDTYLARLEEIIPKLLSQVRPDFVFYLSGVDVLESDKLGKLKLSKAGCQQRDQYIYTQLSKAGLPASKAHVRVGPPLSANSNNKGSVSVRSFG